MMHIHIWRRILVKYYVLHVLVTWLQHYDGSQILLQLTYLKIWNTGAQKLFTELKISIFRQELSFQTVFPKAGNRISHLKNGLKISFGTRFISGWDDRLHLKLGQKYQVPGQSDHLKICFDRELNPGLKICIRTLGHRSMFSHVFWPSY